jgi:hypothetical protein
MTAAQVQQMSLTKSTFYSALALAVASTQTLATEGQIVIEDLTPSQLRGEIKIIETEFYRVFNRSIENENLAIACYDHISTGSNIKAEACEPQFVIDKRGYNANDARLGYDLLLTPPDLQSILAAEYDALSAAMPELSAQSEYFRELNRILSALREEQESR